MENKCVIIRERSTDKETSGVLYMILADKRRFFFYTLELPDKNNQQNISCIPSGAYVCIYTNSAHLKKYTYEVLDVPNREGIRIHAANYFSQLKGCIALGKTIGDINHDGEKDVLNSRIAIREFEDLLQRKPFTLIII